MANLIKAKAGKLTIGDGLLIALAKVFEEKMTSPIIGNGTLMSGGIKLLGAGMVKNIAGGKIGDILGTALVVDGAEDVVVSLLGQTASGNSSSGSVI